MVYTSVFSSRSGNLFNYLGLSGSWCSVNTWWLTEFPVHCFTHLSLEKWKWKSLSRVWLFATPWTIQSMEFSRPEYLTGPLIGCWERDIQTRSGWSFQTSLACPGQRSTSQLEVERGKERRGICPFPLSAPEQSTQISAYIHWSRGHSSCQRPGYGIFYWADLYPAKTPI